MKAALAIAGAVFVCGICVLVKMLDQHPHRDLVGAAVACSPSFPSSQVQAEILEYGLEDVRGLACKVSGEDQYVFLSEGKRSILLYSTKFASIVKQPPLACPGVPCQVIDRRGLAFLGNSLYVVEHGRGQIILRNLESSITSLQNTGDSGNLLSVGQPIQGVPEPISAPVGIAAVGQTLFVSDDQSADPSLRETGTVYSCFFADCKPQVVAKLLDHPSGVAAANKDGPIYVAEMNAHQVRWPIFRRGSDDKWIRSGVLGSAPITDPRSTPFLGIALDESRSSIFAAGPGGLYIFGKNGTNSGRIMFDEPVTGVTSCGSSVYFAVGHMLCRLDIHQLGTAEQRQKFTVNQ